MDVDSIQLILMPYTYAQPEKALIFMQWLMTDDEVSEILTFGTSNGKLAGYRYTYDGNVIFEENNTLYAFSNLIANFSDKIYPYNNKTFDKTYEYREMTYRAIYPPLIKNIQTQHSNISKYLSFARTVNNDFNNPYYNKVFKRLCVDPIIEITSEFVKDELSKMRDKEILLAKYSEFIFSMLD